MASEQAKADWKRIKKAKGTQAANLTKLHTKPNRLFDGNIAAYDLRKLERALTSIE